MSDQAPWLDKLDEPLTNMLAVTHSAHMPDLYVPVVIRCAVDDHDLVEEHVVHRLGFVRHRLRIIPALTGFVPLDALAALADDRRVIGIELSQRTSIASTPSETPAHG